MTSNGELSAFKLKTMGVNKIAWPESKSSRDLSDLDKFLENEKVSNSSEPWCKLDKTSKLKKLATFAEKYKNENNMSDPEYPILIAFFRDCLDKKKLQRVKDVTYDKETGEIIDIPGLMYNKSNSHFTLKNLDKRVSTSRGLAPKKKQGTVKNNKHVHSDDSDNDA